MTRRSDFRLRTAATAAPQAPVPQAQVSPEPRSPHPHMEFGRTDHLNKFGIDPVGEEGVTLKLRTDFFQLDSLNVIDKGDTVRIPIETQVTAYACPSTCSG